MIVFKIHRSVSLPIDILFVNEIKMNAQRVSYLRKCNEHISLSAVYILRSSSGLTSSDKSSFAWKFPERGYPGTSRAF